MSFNRYCVHRANRHTARILAWICARTKHPLSTICDYFFEKMRFFTILYIKSEHYYDRFCLTIIERTKHPLSTLMPNKEHI